MKGFNLALSKLGDPTCLAAISELAGVLDRDGPEGAQNILQGIYERNNFAYVPTLSGGAIAQTVESGINSTIRLSDKFFAAVLGASHRDREGLDYVETHASTILHELVHALRGNHANDEISANWNDRIYDDCFAKRP